MTQNITPSLPPTPPAPFEAYDIGIDTYDHRYIADRFTDADNTIIGTCADETGASALTAASVPVLTQEGHRYVNAGPNAAVLAGTQALAGPITVAMVARRKGVGLYALELANYRIRAPTVPPPDRSAVRGPPPRRVRTRPVGLSSLPASTGRTPNCSSTAQPRLLWASPARLPPE
ncbi:hypothetical protein [Arthrobacter sp. Marseille-P9274]|uniref:hypothetical protein n=1 Tax=Arthrobacter sp. Marseille-P9274 TaxID=2866572 RepID=UPI0021C5CA81|nr:hypothetical protein [Arthrobacter sp. Marseille-P9274]